VAQREPKLFQGPPDEQPAVATGGIFLATEQGDRAGSDVLLQLTYTIEERAGTSDQRVVYPAVTVVEDLPFGPPAELSAEEEMPYAVIRQNLLKRPGIEVRNVPGVRVRTDVRDRLDPVPPQQTGEPLSRMVGMPDREHRVHIRPLICDREVLSVLTLRTVPSIIPALCFPQTLFRNFGRRISRWDHTHSGRMRSLFRTGREFFHLIGISGGYKVGFAAGCLLHSVAKVLRIVSGVRVFENVREDIGLWVESTFSLPYLRGL
jgi:hypothetical protein